MPCMMATVALNTRSKAETTPDTTIGLLRTSPVACTPLLDSQHRTFENTGGKGTASHVRVKLQVQSQTHLIFIQKARCRETGRRTQPAKVAWSSNTAMENNLQQMHGTHLIQWRINKGHRKVQSVRTVLPVTGSRKQASGTRS